MNGIKASRVVTTVIALLILLFAGLIARTLLGKSAPAVSGSGTPAGGGGGQAQSQGQNRQGGQPQGGQGNRNAAAVKISPVVQGTIENSVLINGDVLPRTQVSIYPTVAGKIAEARFQAGDTVNRGDVVATVDPSRPGEIYSHSPVVSTVGGTILQAPVNPGDTVGTGTVVYVVGDLSTLVIETFVPERFSNAAQRGLGARVFLEALPGENFNALVDEVSPVLDPASRTLKIRLRFADTQGRIAPRADPRIKAGMFATISLVTHTRRNVPVIPRGAVINTYGSWIVFTLNDQDTAVRREVSLGIENEDLVEIRSGLELGERVVTMGQNFLSDGDPVRVLD